MIYIKKFLLNYIKINSREWKKEIKGNNIVKRNNIFYTSSYIS